MTKTQKLANQIEKIAEKHKGKIADLPEFGPRGGTNAARIYGWSHSPNPTISRAFGLAGAPRAKWWSGPAPTPATGIPTCMCLECIRAYETIFGKKA